MPCRCLEVGCGSGYVVASLGLLLQELGVAAHLLATDVNPHAAAATAATLKAHEVRWLAGQPRLRAATAPGRSSACPAGVDSVAPAPMQVHGADVVLCDLASALLPAVEGMVDVLVSPSTARGGEARAGVPRPASIPCPQVFNPPYVPTPDDEVARGGLAAAWAGGARGRRVIDRLLPLVPRLLSAGGEMFMVAVHENDPEGGPRARACRGCEHAATDGKRAPAGGGTDPWLAGLASPTPLPVRAAELVRRMEAEGLESRVALRRKADEEQLTILHFRRPALVDGDGSAAPLCGS